MQKLFNIVPNNFFSPLSSTDREIYADILFLIHQKSSENTSYSFIKEELIDLIEDYFIENKTDIEDTEEKYTSPRDKATYIFRRLKSCGWIDTEYESNQQIMVNLEDYAIAFLNTYINFNESNNFELSREVYGIYHNMKAFEIDKGYQTLTDTIERCKNLISKLRSLNSNIKKYIKNVVKINETDNEKNLQKILDDLLKEYKENIIDKAYFYMKTNDNPVKYKNEFTKLCKEKREPLVAKCIIEQITKIDGISIEEATQKYEDIMNYLEDVFYNIISIMEEIDRKNTKYINVSIERIKIILNNDSNVEGMLLNILKNYNHLNDNDLNIQLSNIKKINNNSLYTPRKIIKTNSVEFQPIEIPSSEQDNKMKQEFYEKIKYSKNNVQKYINYLLKEKNELTENDFDLTNKDNFIMLLLTFIYESDKESGYQITWTNETTKINHFLIPKFKMERRNKND